MEEDVGVNWEKVKEILALIPVDQSLGKFAQEFGLREFSVGNHERPFRRDPIPHESVDEHVVACTLFVFMRGFLMLHVGRSCRIALRDGRNVKMTYATYYGDAKLVPPALRRKLRNGEVSHFIAVTVEWKVLFWRCSEEYSVKELRELCLPSSLTQGAILTPTAVR